jgi:hypothetical protein
MRTWTQTTKSGLVKMLIVCWPCGSTDCVSLRESELTKSTFVGRDCKNDVIVRVRVCMHVCVCVCVCMCMCVKVECD